MHNCYHVENALERTDAFEVSSSEKALKIRTAWIKLIALKEKLLLHFGEFGLDHEMLATDAELRQEVLKTNNWEGHFAKLRMHFLVWKNAIHQLEIILFSHP